MALPITPGNCITILSTTYRLWKDGTLSKISNFFKDQRPKKHHKNSLAEQRQRELRSLAYKLQSHYYTQSNHKTFIPWQAWYDLVKTLKDSLEVASFNSSAYSYLISKLPVNDKVITDNLKLDLLDNLSLMYSCYPNQGKQVRNSIIELLLRNYCFILNNDKIIFSQDTLKSISNSLRYLHEVQLNIKQGQTESEVFA